MQGILYLSFDSLQEGVGASQVLAYVRKIVLTRPVTVISFEKRMPDESLLREVQECGVKWVPLDFGQYGTLGGLSRILRMWVLIDRKMIVHARGNLSGLAALLRFPRHWIWDCRALHADQRRALSLKKGITLNFLLSRMVEYFLAKCSSSIIVITHAVIPIMVSRYKIDTQKMNVISTCVDTDRFEMKPPNKSTSVKVLLAGTFSSAYDVDLMNKIITEMKRHRTTTVTIAASAGATASWKDIYYDDVVSVKHSEMPQLVQQHDVGMSIWKDDLGVCLTSVASTKTAEFLACGRPVFVNSRQGDFKSLLGDSQAGVITESATREEVVEYVAKIFGLLDDPMTPKRCREVAEQDFNLSAGIKKLLSVYDVYSNR